MSEFKGVCVGGGYFSHFHYDAWQRIPEVHIAAVCDLDEEKARAIAGRYDIPAVYTDMHTMLEREKPDFVDIITPPSSHLPLCRIAAGLQVPVICQKPLAPTFEEAQQLVAHMDQSGTRFMVHENWRFQPWYREIRTLVEDGAIGDTLFSLNFRSRMGDGWGEHAYLDRQPYFRDYPRLLVYEIGVHFIDTYRFLAGEINSVFCNLRKLNPVIAGEDAGIIFFEFESGTVGLWDANRYNESNRDNPRYTFGEFLVEGNGGSIRLYTDGTLTVQPLGQPEASHDYPHEDRGFAGDSCCATQQHFIACLRSGDAFETNGTDYLKTLRVQEAVYKSAAEHRCVEVSAGPVE